MTIVVSDASLYSYSDKGEDTIRTILKKISVTSVLLILTMLLVKAPVFGSDKNTDIQTTIFKSYDNWSHFFSKDNSFYLENEITYPLVSVEYINNKKIIANYTVHKTIHKTYNSWDEALAQKEYLVENNITYKLIKAVKQKDSKILLTYKIKQLI